jgi:DNA-binding beta-propeller fold protein YncE
MAIESVRFELIPDWEKCPAGADFSHEDVAAVACDAHDNVYLHTRHADRVSVYKEDGKYVGKWGDGVFNNAHGITIAHEQAYCTDNADHVIRIFDLEGGLKKTLGTKGVGADTGYAMGKGLPAPKIHHNERVVRTADSFNGVCNTAIARNGDIFVADGYGNARIHHYSADGKLLNSWGDIGSGPGQFQLPHGIALDNDENVIVCDRENDRLQFFDRSGKYLTMWTDILRPTHAAVDKDGLIYVTELWRPVEPGQGSFVHGFPDHDLPGRVTVFRKDGKIVARFGDDSQHRADPGNFIAPHGVAIDSRGNLYVSEVSGTFGGRTKRMPMDVCVAHQIQKFARVG